MISDLNNHVFTSESVSEGHPDKVCDQISDAILDECLRIDPKSRVACETLATTNRVIVAGEITTKANLNIDKIIRDVIKDIGYTDKSTGFSYDTVEITNLIHAQSPDISMGVTEDTSLFGEQGAGDQGMMFGFACNETEELMPLPIVYSHKLLKKATELRKNKSVDFLLPDAKSQVSVEYNKDNKPLRITTVVLSHQHTEDITRKDLESFLIENVIKPTLEPTNLIDENTKFYINPTGRFVIGGPNGDTGLTGRKIIVDTYGGMGRHGGGAFSGKDPSKVDRSAAYMARYIAKNLVANNLCEKCEVELAYAIGVSKPISVYVNTFNTSKYSYKELENIVRNNFNLTPKGIIESLDLLKPVYKNNVNYGHFGGKDVSWEKIIKLNI
ncbi:MAG: methionine adenosyltransferase [Sphaerochaetaceae bacterium]|nr:methionine adenosyltransferase [Sphaerochaetaceae bacterium]MDC7236469.1 methionine adenosyltransferase [Sphaerochaetaceae bacterium]MDC7242492.1 methionine adenosyltransferase [Sphaerochaetaceae bacterium]MDC7249158.1 methionine adenosyltransferase [Sphaerochaetaceae bacterium]